MWYSYSSVINHRNMATSMAMSGGAARAAAAEGGTAMLASLPVGDATGAAATAAGATAPTVHITFDTFVNST